MNKHYVTYINTADVNPIKSLICVDSRLLDSVLDQQEGMEIIEVEAKHSYTAANHYVLSGTLTLKTVLPTYTVPTVVSGTTTISGNYVDTVTVSGIPVGSTAYVYDGYFEEGGRHTAHFEEFEDVDDGEFTTAFDVSGFFTIGITTTAPQYKNTSHSIMVI